MAIHELIFEGAWCTDQAEAHIVLAQVEPPAPEIQRQGASRPSVVQTLQNLLGADQKLSQIVTAGRPAILLLPELALGLDDWIAVDELVRSWPRPLILISGFGFNRGDSITAWTNEQGQTTRHAGWPTDDGPAAERVYNGGWCWVHRPGSTACVTFLKSTAEQHNEIHIDGLDHGTTHLAVRVDDLVIFPVICSDLLNIVEGRRMVAREIGKYLDKANQITRVLVAGLLLQPRGHQKWRNAILDVAAIDTERVNICLVNSAHDICSMEEDADRWREYSGMFMAKGRRAYEEQFQAVRRFSTEQIDAAVVRHTSPAVLGGPVRWAFKDATGRHMWAVQKHYGVEGGGPLVETPCQDRFCFETLRLLRRLTETHDAPSINKTDVALVSYRVVSTQIETQTEPEAEILCQKTLFGEPGQEANSLLDADKLSKYLPQADIGFKAVGALKQLGFVEWQTDAKQRGQLHVPEQSIKLLVWCYPYSAIAMSQTLRRWRAELAQTTPLVVFKKAMGAHPEAPSETSRRRDDVGEAPAACGRSADTPRNRELMVEYPLEDLEGCFAQTDLPAFASAVQQQLDAALQNLDATGGADEA